MLKTITAAFACIGFFAASPLYSVGAYAASTATAIGRQMNNRHWISYVLAGAGIGILSIEVGYLIADQIFKDRGARPVLHKDPLPVDGKPSFIEMRLSFAVSTSKDLTKKRNDLYATNGFNLGLKAYASYFHSRHTFDFDIINEIDQQGNTSYEFLASEKISFNHMAFGMAITALLW